MAETRHGVVRTDALSGTDDRARLVSLKYMGADGATATAIDNGNVVVIDGYIDGEREVFVGKDMTASDTLGSLALVAAVESGGVFYDERKKNLDEFYTEADGIVRGYLLKSGDMFSVTAEALSGTPALDSYVAVAAGTKLAVAADAGIGKIIAVETVGRHTYYVIRIA